MHGADIRRELTEPACLVLVGVAFARSIAEIFHLREIPAQEQPDTEEQDEPDENPGEETDDRFLRKKRRKKYKNGGM